MAKSGFSSKWVFLDVVFFGLKLKQGHTHCEDSDMQAWFDEAIASCSERSFV